MTVLIPVRFPLNKNSKATLERGLELAGDNGDVLILHVDLYQNSRKATRNRLKREVESKFGQISADYVVKKSFLVERAILEEAANHNVDVIVIGRSRVGKLRRTLDKLVGNDPKIEEYLRENLDIKLEVV